MLSILQIEFNPTTYVFIIITALLCMGMGALWYFFDKIPKKWLRFGYLLPFTFAVVAIIYYNAIGSTIALILIILLTVTGAVFQYFYQSKMRNAAKSEPAKPKTDEDRQREKEEKDYKAFKYKVQFQRGLKHYKDQKYKKAAEAFVACLVVEPDAAEPWYYIGMTNKARNRIPQAKKAFSEALRRNRGYTKAKQELTALLDAEPKSSSN